MKSTTTTLVTFTEEDLDSLAYRLERMLGENRVAKTSVSRAHIARTFLRLAHGETYAMPNEPGTRWVDFDGDIWTVDDGGKLYMHGLVAEQFAPFFPVKEVGR